MRMRERYQDHKFGQKRRGAWHCSIGKTEQEKPGGEHRKSDNLTTIIFDIPSVITLIQSTHQKEKSARDKPMR